jgi:hypothetical protein
MFDTPFIRCASSPVFADVSHARHTHELKPHPHCCRHSAPDWQTTPRISPVRISLITIKPPEWESLRR